jgi:hypothetical protein
MDFAVLGELMRLNVALLITVAMLVGCAAKKPIVKSSIPPKCILGGVVNQAKCEPFQKGLLVCDRVVIEAACIEVKK